MVITRSYSTYLSGMAEYTNRAPLFAAEGASVRDYASKLTQLRGNLSAAGLADRVVYEIGKCVQCRQIFILLCVCSSSVKIDPK